MKGQLDLLGGEVTAADELTERQRAVYLLVCANPDGVPADEAGAAAHELRDRNPHSRDDRCLYCADDGRQILHALRDRGLVRGRRNPRGGLLYVATDPAAAVDAVKPGLGDIPF